MPAPPDDSGLAPGTVVAGKLRVVRLLGTGGMGAVYEVEHELTKHRRALKVLHRRVLQAPTVVERFLREASAAARIGNAHIAETFDAGSLATGEPYLLMEMLSGETLDERLNRLGAIDPGELSALIGQACEGVEAAHQAGIVHRDLKPENLFITTRDGVPFVKVLDFGISKFDAERTGALEVTAEGAIMGTPYYMPPEQVRGTATVDARADVYALGVILYECASGVRPYDAPSLEQLAVLIHIGNAMPLHERAPGLPSAFCDVVHHAMAVERDDRFPTARALADALVPFGAALRPQSSLPPRESMRVVIRPSVPASGSGSGLPPPMSVARPRAPNATTTETALADTLGTNPPPATHATPWNLVFAGGAVAAVMALWALLTPHTLPVSSTIQGEPPPPLTPRMQSSAPAAAASVATSIPSPIAATVDASAPKDATSLADASGLHPASAPPAARAKPAAVSTAKRTVDTPGLAGENPFR